MDYILPIAACLYALLQLFKDWEKHKTNVRRVAALVLVLLLGIGSAFNTHYSKLKAEKLQKELTTVENELQKTQKALEPGPKAELNFSFFPFPHSYPFNLVKEKTLTLNADGSVHVEFSIVNTTDVDAVNAEINLQICNDCKYAKEPDGFSKLPGLTNNQRYLFIPNLLAKMAYKTLSVDVFPPPLLQSFAVGIEYRCHPCIIAKEPSAGTVRISRP